MIGGNQILQVARSVANGDGEWGDVPRCVREAIVLALAGPDSHTAQQIDTTAAAEELLQQQHHHHQQQKRYCSPWPPPREENRLAPSLTEEVIQRSVSSFEDAAWLRDQAVRSFAQFHNTVEGLREGMRHHLRALWRTAVQLDPALMYSVQRQYNLRPGDEIPESVHVSAETQQQLLHLQSMIEEVNNSVETLRAASVRFAANLLSDDEKRAMGLNPANLRPEDLDSHNSSRGTSLTTLLQRHVNNAHENRAGGSGGVPRMLFDEFRGNSTEGSYRQPQERYVDDHHPQPHHNRSQEEYHDHNRSREEYRHHDRSQEEYHHHNPQREYHDHNQSREEYHHHDRSQEEYHQQHDRTQEYHHNEPPRESNHHQQQQERDRQYQDDTFTPKRKSSGPQQSLSELRRRYMQHIALLNEAALHHISDRTTSQGRPSSSLPSSFLSNRDSLM
ncbi:uncharacterized protein TM35_000062440 [Trypanosoma theileri]|uniref:Uncharacterized protein n=1 Tax=Trypanosoma theileri TaxID=67003 RepID=A0A1X0P3U2_9TRYP|nr:uncharacterized protein TM35_000062440 [Trypanosoma theileri]ORC91239.1 hypothetical protein TM35_000062440 [Trypanosoma theileri]